AVLDLHELRLEPGELLLQVLQLGLERDALLAQGVVAELGGPHGRARFVEGFFEGREAGGTLLAFEFQGAEGETDLLKFLESKDFLVQAWPLPRLRPNPPHDAAPRRIRQRAAEEKRRDCTRTWWAHQDSN